MRESGKRRERGNRERETERRKKREGSEEKEAVIRKQRSYLKTDESTLPALDEGQPAEEEQEERNGHAHGHAVSSPGRLLGPYETEDDAAGEGEESHGVDALADPPGVDQGRLLLRLGVAIVGESLGDGRLRGVVDEREI